MEEKLVHILNEMAEYLSISQMKKLQEVLLKNLSETEAHKTEVSNTEYLQMFLDAKKIEGCSEHTAILPCNGGAPAVQHFYFGSQNEYGGNPLLSFGLSADQRLWKGHSR